LSNELEVVFECGGGGAGLSMQTERGRVNMICTSICRVCVSGGWGGKMRIRVSIEGKKESFLSGCRDMDMWMRGREQEVF
jgi:hypothetical protein